MQERLGNNGGIRTGGAKQRGEVGPWLQAQGFSSEKTVSPNWGKDPDKAKEN